MIYGESVGAGGVVSVEVYDMIFLPIKFFSEEGKLLDMLFKKSRTDPGDDMFKPCPNCGADEVYSTGEWRIEKITDLWYPRIYLCDECGYEPHGREIEKSITELWKEASPNYKKLETIGDSELIKQVDDKKVEGWKIEKVDTAEMKVIMRRSKGGSVGGHALAGLLSLGLGNIIYDNISQAKNKERIVLRAKQKTSSNIGEDATEARSASEKLRELNKLCKDGVITEQEFNLKKEELLNEF